MRFTGTVIAVFVANLLTFALIAGVYVYLNSEHGQKLSHELGLRPLLSSLSGADQQADGAGTSSERFVQPRHSDMQPMRVTPRQTNQSQLAHSPPRKTETSSPERNQSVINSSLKICRFWNAEFTKDRSSKSKSFRDLACKRYERLSGLDSRKVVNMSRTQPTKPNYQERREQEEREMEAKQLAREQRNHEQYCEGLRERIDHYDSLLRRGGKAHYVNRLRGERRELSLEYSRKCMLGQ